ncbi:MAG: DUF3800 domain-containing protein [Methylotenera sp.]
MADCEDQEKVIIDAENLRNGMVNQLFGPPLYGTEDEWVFYYDETNNIRKLHLTEDGANAEFKNFVLGGIAHPRNRGLPDTNSLIESLVLQKSATEIKFNQLATGSFLGVLNSKKIRTLLKWLIDNDIYIHYTNFNILYWSLVDLVDSLWSDEEILQYAPYQLEIKNELFRLCNIELDIFTQLLRKYHYPNIKRSQNVSFMSEVADHFESFTKEPRTDITKLVIALMRHGATIEEMAFLVDNDDDILINSFKDMYLRPIYIYPNSIHIFDKEDSVQIDLKNHVVKFRDRLVSYSFVDSKQSIGIQISDGICGLLGSYFNFLEENTIEQLKGIKSKLNLGQTSTLELLKTLIDASDEASNGFCHRIAPTDSDFKNQFFLFNIS